MYKSSEVRVPLVYFLTSQLHLIYDKIILRLPQNLRTIFLKICDISKLIKFNEFSLPSSFFLKLLKSTLDYTGSR